jgi:hypothetical protein
MSDLVALASQKLDLAAEDRVRALPGQIKAVKAENAAKGLARSGATLMRARAICIAHLQEHGEAVAVEYTWVVNQALMASQTWTERLAATVPARLQPLMTASATQLTELAAFTGRPELASGLIADVEAELRIVEERTKLAVRTLFAEKSRGLLRSVPTALGGVLSKLFRPGL